MKVRMVALAGVSLLAFTLAAAAGESGGATSGGATSSGTSAPPMQPPPPPPPPPPAPAAEWMTQGWYVGVGAGWDRADPVEYVVPGVGSTTAKTNDAALITGTVGYRFMDRIRLEGEFGWDSHDVPLAQGSNRLVSFLANAAYDFPLGSKWDFTLGAGAGIGDLDAKVAGFSDTHQGFMWQGFTGFDYWIRRDISVNLDWRYRSLSENESYFGVGVRLKQTNEQAVMVSLRYYPFSSQ